MMIRQGTGLGPVLLEWMGVEYSSVPADHMAVTEIENVELKPCPGDENARQTERNFQPFPDHNPRLTVRMVNILNSRVSIKQFLKRKMDPFPKNRPRGPRLISPEFEPRAGPAGPDAAHEGLCQRPDRAIARAVTGNDQVRRFGHERLDRPAQPFPRRFA